MDEELRGRFLEVEKSRQVPRVSGYETANSLPSCHNAPQALIEIPYSRLSDPRLFIYWQIAQWIHRASTYAALRVLDGRLDDGRLMSGELLGSLRDGVLG